MGKEELEKTYTVGQPVIINLHNSPFKAIWLDASITDDSPDINACQWVANTIIGSKQLKVKYSKDADPLAGEEQTINQTMNRIRPKVVKSEAK